MSEDAWNDAEKEAETHSGSDKFVSLKGDKDKVVGVFLGSPHTRELWYNPRKDQYEDYTEEHKKAGKDPSLRVSLNMLVRAEGNGEDMNKVNPPKVKIIEGGVKWFKSVLKMKKKYGLDKKWYEIERNGAKGDTKTTYSVLPDDDIGEDERKDMKKLDLHDLAKNAGGSENDDAAPGDSDFDSYAKDKNAPIDGDDADKITGVLRQRPREDIDKFLSKFGIKRIKALKKSDLEAALAFVKELEGDDDDDKKEDGDEVDPFA